MLTGREKLVRARVKLKLTHPFFGYLSLYLDFIEDENIETIGETRNGELHYNPDFTDGLDEDMLRFVLCHELVHLALLHPERQGNRNKMVIIQGIDGKPQPVSLWNLACDIAVNGELRKNLKLFNLDELPAGSIYHPKFDGKCAEEIYDMLDREIQSNKKLPVGIGYQPFDKHLWEEPSGGNKAAVKKNDWSRIVQEARIFADRFKGDVPGGMLREIDELLQPRLRTRDLLKKAIVEKLSSEYNWLQPSRRYYQTGVYTPGMKNGEAVEVAIIVDTSGSMNKREIAQSLTEVKAIFEEYEQAKVILMDVDAKVYSLWVIESVSQLLDKVKEIKGGEGTSYIPAFKKLNEMVENGQKIRLAILFGDLMGDFPKEKPPYDVILVATKRDVEKEWVDKASRIGSVIYLE